MTDLRWRSPICGFLRFSAKSSVFWKLETGIGGKSPKIRGGGKFWIFRGPWNWPLSTEYRQFGGQKSKLSRGNFRGELPPLYRSVRFDPPHPGFRESLRFSAVSCAHILEFLGEGVNLRKSALFCENLRFGLSLSPKFCPLKRAPNCNRCDTFAAGKTTSKKTRRPLIEEA